MRITIDHKGLVQNDFTGPDSLAINVPISINSTLTINGTTSYPTNIEIYVNPTGSDSNSGTATNPVLTFAKALNLTKPLWGGYQRIFMASGSYTETGSFNYHVPNSFEIGAFNLKTPLEIIGNFDTLLTATLTQITFYAFLRSYFTHPTLSVFSNSSFFEASIL